MTSEMYSCDDEKYLRMILLMHFKDRLFNFNFYSNCVLIRKASKTFSLISLIEIKIAKKTDLLV